MIVKEYKLLYDNDQVGLSKQVNKYLMNGWELYGSPCSSTGNCTHIFQAVVRTKKVGDTN